jgi:hypothetical protein
MQRKDLKCLRGEEREPTNGYALHPSASPGSLFLELDTVGGGHGAHAGRDLSRRSSSQAAPPPSEAADVRVEGEPVVGDVTTRTERLV